MKLSEHYGNMWSAAVSLTIKYYNKAKESDFNDNFNNSLRAYWGEQREKYHRLYLETLANGR